MSIALARFLNGRLSLQNKSFFRGVLLSKFSGFFSSYYRLARRVCLRFLDSWVLCRKVDWLMTTDQPQIARLEDHTRDGLHIQLYSCYPRSLILIRLGSFRTQWCYTITNQQAKTANLHRTV